MTSTTFVNNETVIVASWYNDVNDFVYNGILPPSFIVQVASGGTGATTASGARTNLGLEIGVDVQAYSAFLTALAGLSNGIVVKTTGSAVSRTITGTAGEVTVTNGDGVSGNPTLGVGAQLQSIATVGNGLVAHTASNTFTPRTITGSATNGIGVTNGDGVSGNPTLALDIASMTNVAPDTADYVPIYDVSGSVNRYATVGAISSAGSSGVTSLTGTANQITASAATGAVTLSVPYQFNIGASASGPSELRMFEDTDNGANKVTVVVPASIASDATLTLQATTGTVYSSGGTNVAIADGGTNADDAAGARTNLGLAIGTDVQAYSAQLDSAASVGNGMIAHTAANTFTPRTITQPAAGITVTNGDGVSGNPTLALANDLAALEGLSTNGIIVRTNTDTMTTRTITGTANRITVSNGDGVSGSPTLDVGSNVYTVGGTDVAVTDGGTGVSTMTTAYAPVCAGTTATGALQVASTGLSTSGFVLTSNGASALPSFQAASGGGVLDRQVYNSSTTWNKPSSPGTNSVTFIQAWGAGGAGGNAASGNGAGGGGGGAYVETWVLTSALASSETVTIGAAAGQSSAGNSGSSGGTSSFGSWINAFGGGGGAVGGTGGGGGGGASPLSAGNIATAGGAAGTLGGAASTGSWAGGGGSPGTNTGVAAPAGGTAGVGGGGGGGGSDGGGTAGFGGASLYGGGGGGGSADTGTGGTGGASTYAGAGGNGGSNGGAPGSGTQPGGGGGGAENQTSGAGGSGRIIVTVYKG